MFNAVTSPRRSNAHPSSEHRSPRKRISQAFTNIPNRISKAFTSNREPARDPELEELETQVKRLQEEEEGLNTRLHELESELGDTKWKQENEVKEYERITKELAVAQKFLSTADSLSQADVVQAAESLNEEIFQLTSILADQIQLGDKELRADYQARFRQKISALGPAFLDGIIPLELDDPLAIQIGWQAILASWCCDIVQAWVLRGLGKQGINKVIDDAYQGVTTQSGQAIGGRWRSMLLQVADEVPPDTREELVQLVIPALIALPVVCGYINSQKPHEDLGNAFHQRIGHLLDKCLNLRKKVGEEFTSADIRPYLIASGDVYDPERADLEYEDERNAAPNNEGEIIACSLGVGLYCTRSKQSSDGRFLGIREPILKPKAVLQRTLKEITEPLPE
ncbi:hypothetical protein Agabi119p4_2240 [Agaricus bisporus var. burnettii]|uniref:Uncharacterized protein n=1 Tax=Agaricus bisporus var. burnettii TaxID=192524 RepID=A0A8H7KJS5_AGABI|nr:hypothetical protein Agabi119p4_2240 [Agaricus bisporus var. burnettii]